MPRTNLIKERSKKLCGKLKLGEISKLGTIGRYGELLAYEKFLELGIESIPYCLGINGKSYSDYDFLLMEKRIEVKCAYPSLVGRYIIILTKNQNKFDYLMVVLLAYNLNTPAKYLIISAENVKNLAGFSMGVDKESKWLQYENKWNLLKR